MLKFSVQTFYQPLFSHSFPFSSFPLAILFPSKSFPHKKPKAKHQSEKPKPKGKAQSKSQRQISPSSSFGVFYKQP
jgi:hypothetical protein